MAMLITNVLTWKIKSEDNNIGIHAVIHRTTAGTTIHWYVGFLYGEGGAVLG